MPPLLVFVVNQVIFNQISQIFSTVFTEFRIPLGEDDQQSYTNLSHQDTMAFHSFLFSARFTKRTSTIQRIQRKTPASQEHLLFVLLEYQIFGTI